MELASYIWRKSVLNPQNRFYLRVQIIPEKHPSLLPTPASPAPASWAQYLVTPALQLDTFSLKGPWGHSAILRLLVLRGTKLQSLLEFPTEEGGVLTLSRETKLAPLEAGTTAELLIPGGLTQHPRNFLFLQACWLLEVAVHIPRGGFPQPAVATWCQSH